MNIQKGEFCVKGISAQILGSILGPVQVKIPSKEMRGTTTSWGDIDVKNFAYAPVYAIQGRSRFLAEIIRINKFSQYSIAIGFEKYSFGNR
jgi:hypothetical protein